MQWEPMGEETDVNYYTREIQSDEGVQKTAGIKARDDVEAILGSMGFKELLIETKTGDRDTANFISKFSFHRKVRSAWKRRTGGLSKGDYVFVQFPCIEHSLFLFRVFRQLNSKGIRVVFIIHDLELLRVSKRDDISRKKKLRMRLEERTALLSAYRIIAHNNHMMDYLVELGVDRKKLVPLEIFDYIMDEDAKSRLSEKKSGTSLPVVIAGNLRPHKAQYAYHLPDNQSFNLYGVDYEGVQNEKIVYKGAFAPEEIPFVMEGSFGLVWDGDSADTCSGVYGEYLKINNPHKTSLYLAAGLPVIIWKEAALADFVKENGCGITVGSLGEIADRIQNMSRDEYDSLKDGAALVGSRMRDGFYLKKAVGQCMER